MLKLNRRRRKRKEGGGGGGKEFCVYCVGKIKPRVLSSQVSAGRLQLERKEIQVVCITFDIRKGELVNHETSLRAARARLPSFFPRNCFHVLLLYDPELRLVKGEWKMFYSNPEDSLPRQNTTLASDS